MEDTSLIRKILFYILIVLTIVFIYMIFFPKKSYVEDKLVQEMNPLIDETFNQNVSSMLIAGTEYFKNNGSSLVTLKELIDKNLLVELKDSNANMCDVNNSNVQKKENGYVINLVCPDKKGSVSKVSSDEQQKLICIYQYKKKIDASYSDWGEFSNWQESEVKKDDLTNVEIKEESVLDGTKTITKSRNVSIKASINTKVSCPNGYTLANGRCKKETFLNTIGASISYTCPSGYNKNGAYCVLNGDVISATKSYFCGNYEGLELKLNGSNCDVYRINYIESNQKQEYYTCPSGYNLVGDLCETVEYYDEEVDNYKNVTYYRYQKRTKIDEKYEIKWSKPNDQDLISNGFIQDIKINCEI